MDVIPVIDLKKGTAVRARLGRREFYAPIKTPLSATSAPVDVAAGFLALHPFPIIYVADLDAIEGTGDHREALLELYAAFPETMFWVDAGARDGASARAFLARHRYAHLVIGSESLDSVEPLKELRNERRLILSLDFRGDALVGPSGLLDAPHLWPARVIVMTFGRIGANAGPDLSRVAAVKALGARTVFAAGGVRDAEDLEALKRGGVAGALVASALHDGQLTGRDLAATPEMARGSH
ncbi:HisA/HisF-related TIM barrel protein [Methylocella sp.]|uniref:HisA/HisF-related TIM barrel protein n=1 Tax=Methylocella sp. TaxID=1978226 RepID=UPI003783C19C